MSNESEWDKEELDLNNESTETYLEMLDLPEGTEKEIMRETIDYKKAVGRGIIWKDGLVPNSHLDNILDNAENEIGTWVEEFGRDWARFRLQAWIFVGLAATSTPAARKGDVKAAHMMATKLFGAILSDIQDNPLLAHMVKHDVLTMGFQVPDDLSGLDIDLGD